MNIKRILSTVLGLPLVGIVLIFGNIYLVDIACAIIAIMALHEYFKCFQIKSKALLGVGYFASALIACIHLIPLGSALILISVLVPIVITILFALVIFSEMKTNIKDIAITFFGICYITIFFMFIPIINGMKDGKILVWYPMIASWGTDIFAYIIGKKFGKHKFSEISPNKTIEGCIGGIIGAIILTIIYTCFVNIYTDMNISYIYITIVSIVLSIIGQLGDFAASSIKRYVGVKDFSDLIPGHGGILDRIDSVLFIAPFAYMLLMLLKFF